MKTKKLISAILLLFVAISVGAIALRGSGKMAENTTNAVDSPAGHVSLIQPDVDMDVVYYFMTTQRCVNCVKIESFTKEAIQAHFNDQLNQGQMVWRMVNVDEPQNRHFIKDYELFTKSVVLVRYRNGKQVDWKNLDQLWTLLGDKSAFQTYVTAEIGSFFGES